MEDILTEVCAGKDGRITAKIDYFDNSVRANS